MKLKFPNENIFTRTVYWIDWDGEVQEGKILDIRVGDCQASVIAEPTWDKTPILPPHMVMISKNGLKKHVLPKLQKKKEELEAQIEEIEKQIREL